MDWKSSWAICRRVFLLAMGATLCAAGEEATDRALCQKEFLHIVSPDAQNVRAQQCRAVADQVMLAWKFDLAQNRWRDPPALEKSPLTLRLLSVERMKTEHAGVLGYAKGRDLFVVSLAVLDDPFANGTLAHELAHIQAYRAEGKTSNEKVVPHYFMEGHGNILGLAYRDHLGVAKHDYDRLKAKRIAKLDAAEARTILTDPDYGIRPPDKTKVDIMEAMGIFFVEYLRTRYRGHGLPDAVPRMARVFELVNQGEGYDAAFQKEFGGSVSQAVSDVTAFMKRTEGNGAARLKGTRYEEFVTTNGK